MSAWDLKDTADMFEFLGNDWKEILAERHGAKFLPKRYGGLMDDNVFRKGGIVPASLCVIKIFPFINFKIKL